MSILNYEEQDGKLCFNPEQNAKKEILMGKEHCCDNLALIQIPTPCSKSKLQLMFILQSSFTILLYQRLALIWQKIEKKLTKLN